MENLYAVWECLELCLHQDIAEAQQAVVDKTDIVKGVSKVTSKEPVPLCKAHTEGEIVVSMAKVDTAAVHAEDVNLQSWHGHIHIFLLVFLYQWTTRNCC